MKKLLSAILAVVMILSAISGICVSAATVFNDVKANAWYASSVFTVNAFGIMEGKGDGKFAPNASMTRAELVTVLYRMSGEVVWGTEDSLSYKDVKENAWYAEAVGWAVSRELATGYPDNTFKPNSPVLRQELAKMFVTFLEYMEITEKGTPLVESFADSAKFPDWAAEYIESLRETGLMGGDDSGKFKPKSKASRAEIATVLTRLLPLMKEDTDTGSIGDGSEYVPAIAPDNFELCTEDEAPKPYYIRFPDGYSESEKYPLVIFTAGSDSASIDGIGACFSDADSPVYESIVMIPGVGLKKDLEHCGELFAYVTGKYSVDTERVYLIATGEDDGAFFTFKALEKHPMSVSAALFVHGAVDALYHNDAEDEEYTLEGTYWKTISDEMKDLPIYYINCNDDYHPVYEYNVDPKYGDRLQYAFVHDGFTATKSITVDGFLQIYDSFCARKDIGSLEWLFAQRRETK
ncbi:MAG: S-layer homology domain-containing protein [Clostridia bacterium]|nr:S-layer homology domain-containing protein [Clostridia bacterium]